MGGGAALKVYLMLDLRLPLVSLHNIRYRTRYGCGDCSSELT